MVLKPEQFTEQAQQVIGESQAIVRRCRHSQWDSEHVLLALLEHSEGVPAEVLQELGVPVDAMRDRLAGLLERAPRTAGESAQIYVTPRAAGMLDRARSEADRLNDEFIGAEHLLVRKRPFRVILFDEIEKAHPDVFNTLLQIMEDGRLTDGHGRTVDFRNTLVLMTSNVGTAVDQRASVGLLGTSGASDDSDSRQTAIRNGLKETFRPEFLNRIDEIVVFDTLTREQLERIVGMLVSEVDERMREHGLKMSLTSEAAAWLASNGHDPMFGARPLRRAVQRFVESPLSKRLLAGDFTAGDRVEVEAGDDELLFRKLERPVAAA